MTAPRSRRATPWCVSTNDAEQLKARDVVKDEKAGIAKDYVNAMMYASRAPRWMQALGLRAMPLGLDLRGGLYLLYQVDVDGAVEQAARQLRPGFPARAA